MSPRFHGPQIRLVLNEETYPLRSCAHSKRDRKYGTCSLEAFTAANKISTDIKFDDDKWKSVCSVSAEGLYVQGEFLGA